MPTHSCRKVPRSCTGFFLYIAKTLQKKLQGFAICCLMRICLGDGQNTLVRFVNTILTSGILSHPPSNMRCIGNIYDFFYKLDSP